jgi:hypothetical protein
MNLTQFETVETELKHKRYSQNKVLKLTGLKKTDVWTPRTLKTDKRWKIYG